MLYTYQEHGAIHYWEYWQFYSIQDANLLFNFFEVFKDEHERGECGMSVEECLSKSWVFLRMGHELQSQDQRWLSQMLMSRQI